MHRPLVALSAFVFLLGIVRQASAVPIMYLRFEEGSGTYLVDSVTNTVVGTSNAAYSTNVPVNPIPQTGQPNAYSLQFNGNAVATITGAPFLFNSGFGNGTLEFWVDAPNQPNTRSIFWTRPDTSDTNRFNLYLSPGGWLGFDYRTPLGDLHTLLPGDGTFTIPLDTWTFVAITRTGNTYQFYEDGSLVYTSVDSNPDLPTSTAWTIAGRPIPGQSSSPDFVGSVDEVRFSNTALSPSQFLDAPQATPEPSCLVLWGVGGVVLVGYSRLRRLIHLQGETGR